MMIRAKSKLSFFNKLVLYINYVFAFSILISYLAPVTDPKNFWPIAFFGIGYPILLAVNVLFIIYWAINVRIYAFISLVCILVGWKVLNNNIGFNKSQPDVAKASPEDIRMMAYNVHQFQKFNFTKTESTRSDIFKIIDEQKPDIMVFEEFYTRSKGKNDIIDSLKRLLKTDQFYFEAFDKNHDDKTGLAIFTKYAIVNHGMIRLNNDNSDNQCIYADMQKGDKTIRVYCVHLQSIHFESEDYVYLDSLSHERPSIHKSKRVGGKLKLAFLKHSEQVHLIKDHMAKCPYPYIVAGDFNDTPTSYAVNKMAQGLKNTFYEKGSGLVKTYNGDFPNFQIDFIMCSPVFNVLNYHVVERKLSDHYPIRSDLQLK
ncbi:endonuclease/exonuclease/phosphatase family protein [Mucilaginibacter sp. HMF5004]|uniref:endonuclease/exonuclease/phosphatase family protein n=1 Tax=Mucilaginibacter rivuli TaxID=2857527 RepID=UPI001C5D0996|nr:endonuclease/exonuclease/phosphatase family protein [Mucilaginibacter rivuli]MBW4891186.1 endonuclease/exonuclease/phosphatase family protein [Mucilaginibacter rivuli]